MRACVCVFGLQRSRVSLDEDDEDAHFSQITSSQGLQFDIQIYFGYKYAVRCHRHENNTELHSP